MGEVVEGHFITTMNTDPKRTLEGALGAEMTEVIIVGRDKDGVFYFASSQADSGDVIWYLERAKHELFKMEDRIAEEGDPRGKPRRGS